MSVEIHQPEIEALIEQRMASGAFHDAEDVLLHALRSAPPREKRSVPPTSLVDVCAMVRDISADLKFSRNASTGRPVDLH